MASSTRHLSHFNSVTSAPPPTPSTQPPTSTATPSIDFLSRLLPPPTLSLPTRRSSPPLFSLSSAHLLLSSTLGYFQISDHNISSQLADSAHSQAISLFELTQEQKLSWFPNNFPLGYEEEESEESEGKEQSFWLDFGSSEFESGEVELGCLKSLSKELERVGLDVVEKLLKSAGLENPPNRFCSIMWVHESKGGKTVTSSGGFYPYVVCLEYQIRRRKYSFLSDSGWVTVSPRQDSVMVTVGDIAQVWSNGKLKKVRGKPMASLENDEQSRNISMSLLLTLPLESTVSPLLPLAIAKEGNEVKEGKEEEHENHEEEEEEDRVFSSFSFEDYAWRVHHEPFLSKDPLDRYRI